MIQFTESMKVKEKKEQMMDALVLRWENKTLMRRNNGTNRGASIGEKIT